MIRCPTCLGLESHDGLRCDECYDCCQTLYTGWFYTEARLNPFAVGTATAGLMQNRMVCGNCAEKLQKLGLKVGRC
jgi:hypothetical protein